MDIKILTCSCDSLAAKLCEKLGDCCPKIIESSVNSADVSIVGTICSSIVYIVLIGVCGFIAWKLIEHVVKSVSGYYKRKHDLEDREIKLKADLLDKYLDFLKGQTKDKTNPNSIDQTKSNQYRSVLECLIELSQKGKMKDLSKEMLSKNFNDLSSNEE